jgi:predicted porin
MGRTLTPSYYAFTVWDLTSAANYNVVNSQFGYAGLSSRQNAEFSYTTPEIAGLQATVAHVLAANNAGVSKDDVSVSYRRGPLAAALSYNKLSNTDKNLALGGSYDFGVVRLGASYQDARGAGKGRGYTLGARVPVGLFSFGVDMARDTDRGDTDWLLEARYHLSRRTFVYAAQLSNGAGKAAKEVNTSLLGIRHNF